MEEGSPGLGHVCIFVAVDELVVVLTMGKHGMIEIQTRRRWWLLAGQKLVV